MLFICSKMVRQENNQVRHFYNVYHLVDVCQFNQKLLHKSLLQNVNWVAFVVNSISYSPLSALYVYGNLLVRFLEIFMLLAYLT